MLTTRLRQVTAVGPGNYHAGLSQPACVMPGNDVCCVSGSVESRAAASRKLAACRSPIRYRGAVPHFISFGSTTSLRASSDFRECAILTDGRLQDLAASNVAKPSFLREHIVRRARRAALVCLMLQQRHRHSADTAGPAGRLDVRNAADTAAKLAVPANARAGGNATLHGWAGRQRSAVQSSPAPQQRVSCAGGRDVSIRGATSAMPHAQS